MSKQDIPYEDLIIVKLSSNHDLAGFRCSDDDLDEFIQFDELLQRMID